MPKSIGGKMKKRQPSPIARFTLRVRRIWLLDLTGNGVPPKSEARVARAIQWAWLGVLVLLGTPLVWMLLLTIQAPPTAWIISANFVLGAVVLVWYLRRRTVEIRRDSVELGKWTENPGEHDAITKTAISERLRHLRSLARSPCTALLAAVFVILTWLVLLTARWPTIVFAHRGWFVKWTIGDQIAVPVTAVIVMDSVVLLSLIRRTAIGYGQEFKHLAEPTPNQPDLPVEAPKSPNSPGAEPQTPIQGDRIKSYPRAALIVAGAAAILALAALLGALVNALVSGLSIHGSLTFASGQVAALWYAGTACFLAALLGYVIYRIGKLQKSGRRWAIAGLVATVIFGMAGIIWSKYLADRTTQGSAGVPDHGIAVQDLRHMSESVAVIKLVNAGLTVSVVPVEGFQPVGEVIAQSPAPKVQVSPGSIVTIDVSTIHCSTNSMDNGYWDRPGHRHDWDGPVRWDGPDER